MSETGRKISEPGPDEAQLGLIISQAAEMDLEIDQTRAAHLLRDARALQSMSGGPGVMTLEQAIGRKLEAVAKQADGDEAVMRAYEAARVLYNRFNTGNEFYPSQIRALRKAVQFGSRMNVVSDRAVKSTAGFLRGVAKRLREIEARFGAPLDNDRKVMLRIAGTDNFVPVRLLSVSKEGLVVIEREDKDKKHTGVHPIYMLLEPDDPIVERLKQLNNPEDKAKKE